MTGLFATTPVKKKMSFTKRIDRANRQAAVAAHSSGAAVVGLDHPLAGRRGHRCGRGLDTVVALLPPPRRTV